jgi:hypothetical protein
VLLAIVLLGGGPLLSTSLARQIPTEPNPNNLEEIESGSLLGALAQRRIRRESPTHNSGDMAFTSAGLSVSHAARPFTHAVEHALRNGMGGPLRR